MKNKSCLFGTFNKRIRKQKFEQYCEFFNFDFDEAKREFTQRGYHIMEV